MMHFGLAFKKSRSTRMSANLTYVRIIPGNWFRFLHFNSSKGIKNAWTAPPHARQPAGGNKQAYAGEIVAVVGFKDNSTGDTV
jgi:hypothetical protein